MKIKVLMAAAAATFGIISLTSAVSAATEVASHLPEFDIVVNGRYVENRMRQYPFIIYNDITYFPMTYNDCAFLGVTNDWTPENGTVITTTASNGIYDDLIRPEGTSDWHPLYDGLLSYITEGKITVNGRKIDNSTQQYPILTYKDVPYFPLTWDWCTEFGWTINFDAANGLSVCSPEYNTNGYVNYYSPINSPLVSNVNSCHISELAGKNPENSGLTSYSPNHFRKDPHSPDFKPLYSVRGISYLYVRETEIPRYQALGWYRFEDIDRMFEEALLYSENNELYMLNYTITDFIESTPCVEGADAPARAKQLLDYYKENCITVWTPDIRRSMVIYTSDLEKYKNSGWRTSDDFYIDIANQMAADYPYQPEIPLLFLLGMRGDVDYPFYNNYFDNGMYTTYTGKNGTYYYILGEHNEIYDEIFDILIAGFADSCREISHEYYANAPVVIIAGAPKWGGEAAFAFMNISDKTVSEVWFEYTCDDYAENPVMSENGNLNHCDVLYCNLKPGEVLVKDDFLLVANNIASIPTIELVIVEFADGTTWNYPY